MDTKNIVIIILVIVVAVLAIACSYFVLTPDSNDKVVNTTNVTNNVTNESSEDTQVSTYSKDSSDSSSQSSSQKEYDDWQQDYETGEYDENGNPIYRSVVSTSGGQSEPGIYEAYWSSSGPISKGKNRLINK